MRHLLALAQRIIAKKVNFDQNLQLNGAIKKQFYDEYKIAMTIKQYIQKEFHFEVTEDEVTFLTIHIHRLLRMINRIFYFINFSQRDKVDIKKLGLRFILNPNSLHMKVVVIRKDILIPTLYGQHP